MNYQILNVLQDGPSGKTFLAQDKAGKKVIIRQLKTSLTKLTAENKKTEAQILRTLNHPQIPQYIDEYVDKVEGRRLLHLVREYVEGTVLTVELETQKYTYTTDWQEIYQILLQLLEIVEYIQSLQSPIIHRDIKPSNLIRRSDGKIVLIDFDVATKDIEQTFGHDFAGTIGYQAPEQIAGEPSIQSDVYSVGVVAVELLSNKKPRTLLRGMVLHWQSACLSLPENLQKWLDKMLAVEPAERFASARAAKKSLMAIAGEQQGKRIGESNLPAPDNVEEDFINGLKDLANDHLQTERQRRAKSYQKKKREREAKRRRAQQVKKQALSSARQKQQIKQRADILRQEIRTSFDALISEIGGGRIPLRKGLQFFWQSYKPKLQIREGKSIGYVVTEEMLILAAFLNTIDISLKWNWKAHYVDYLLQRLVPVDPQQEKEVEQLQQQMDSLEQEISQLGFLGNWLKKDSLEQDLQSLQQQRTDLSTSMQEAAWQAIRSRCELFSITKRDFTKSKAYPKRFSRFQQQLVALILVGLTTDFGSGEAAHQMVYVPSGEFLMGALPNDAEALANEKPQHKVIMENSFWFGKYPVTQELFTAITGKKPSYFSGDELPVENVSWCDAILFCNLLSKQEGLEEVYQLPPGFSFAMTAEESHHLAKKLTVKWTANGYRLPTEAEWEYAARAGQSHVYSGSDCADDVAWYGSCFWNGSDWEVGTGGNSQNKTHPVGMKQANAYDIYDMTGNVFEWVWDTFSSHEYKRRKSTSPVDPKGPTSGAAQVVKGGGWYKTTRYARISFRSSAPAGTRFKNTGFRLFRRL